MRSDIAGRPDNKMATVVVELDRRRRRWMPLSHAWIMASTGPINDLILFFGATSLFHHVLRGQPSRYRFVDIEDPAPDFLMLQRQRAAQTPQHRVSGIGAITVAERLRIAGQQKHPRRQG